MATHRHDFRIVPVHTYVINPGLVFRRPNKDLLPTNLVSGFVYPLNQLVLSSDCISNYMTKTVGVSQQNNEMPARMNFHLRLLIEDLDQISAYFSYGFSPAEKDKISTT